MGNTQISREGDRFEVPVDIVRHSVLVTTIIEVDKDGDDNPVLAKIVRLLEYYKQEPSEFVMCFGLICYSRRESVENLLTSKMIVSSANNRPALYIFENR
jgi:hypothetical protein